MGLLKALQSPFGIRWTYNSWISGNGHEVQTGAITVGDSLVGEKSIEWWRSLIRETVNGGVAIDYKDGEALIKRYDRAHCDIPLVYHGERLNMKGDAYVEDEGKIKTTRYQLTHATAVPFDENGNYLIRAKGMVAIGGKKGFGLVEIHCNLQNNIYRGQFEEDKCLILQIKEKKGALVFSYNGKNILVVDIDGSKYLRHLRKIGIGGFSRGLFKGFLSSHNNSLPA
ncbi:MAG: hypothetical protein JRJ77_11630 [Deltaproteobacteria bacterium]|nr:hypothetical protein [Deltaproteobacteria bacterium]MBW1795925.1 hypothetical protein [Deltaproteobacteria bacterium]